MKKLLLSLLAVGCLFQTMAFAEGEITKEDFESYSLTEKYGDGSEYTMTFPGATDVVAKQSAIINAPGGIYEGDEAYEGNAAENVLTYAEQADGTLLGVLGGLNNGWHGAYSHPMLYLQGGQGAASEFNKSNRRVAVINDSGNKVLQLGPGSNAYVSTFSTYGYEQIDFSRPVEWQSDIKLNEIGAAGYAELSLTKGKFAKIEPFVYPKRELGRSLVQPIVTFRGNKTILILDSEAGTYETGKFYTVYMFIDATLDAPSVTITITEKGTENVVAEQIITLSDFDFDGITGVDYYAFTPVSSSPQTTLRIDNIDIHQVIFSAQMASNSAVNINGKGICQIDFNDRIDDTTLNNETVKVYKDNVLLEGTNIEMLEGYEKSTKLSLPELEPQAEYRVVIDGVKSMGGIAASCELLVKAKDIVAISKVKKTSDGLTYRAKNNAAYDATITAVAVLLKDGKIVSDGVHYKQITIPAGGTVDESFTGMVTSETADSAALYIIDSFGTFKAQTVSNVVSN